MVWFPVLLDEMLCASVCVTGLTLVVLIMALPFSPVGAVDAFIAIANLGVVPNVVKSQSRLQFQIHWFAMLGRVHWQILTNDPFVSVMADVNAHLLPVLIRPVLVPPVMSAASVVLVPIAPYVTALPPVELVPCEMTKALLSGTSTCVLAPIVVAVRFVMSVALLEVAPSKVRVPELPPLAPRVAPEVAVREPNVGVPVKLTFPAIVPAVSVPESVSDVLKL